MKTLSKSTQRGYSLIELSIALAIVGVVIAGSIVGVQAILQSNNVNKTIRQTNTAVNKIVAKLVRDPNYANATTQNLSAKGMEVWEQGDITSGGTGQVQVTHPLASFVFVAPLSAIQYGLAAQQGYVYTLTGVPVTACTDLAVGLEGLATAMSIQNKTPIVGGGAAPTQVGANTVKTTAAGFNSATANGFCSGANGAAGAVVDQAEITFLVPRR
jgi:prepilin-type N-terminal cleavage/methylation domain-containing protein